MRYTDLDINTSGAQDFVLRQRKPNIKELALVVVCALLIALGVAFGAMDRPLAGVLLFAVISCIGWYAVLQIQRSNDQMLATEFQNALFASALGLNHRFCLIIKRDGAIVYLDRSFQDLFPEFSRRQRLAIDVLLEEGHVAREDSDKIFSSIERGVFDKVIFQIRGAGGEFNKIVMTIEPILRPSGFILLRGREFIEQRQVEEASAGPGMPESPPQNSTIALFSYMMDSMRMGVYMTNPKGGVVYANPLLEHWLGYREGDAGSLDLSLRDIFHEPSSQVLAQPGDFEGEASLRRKDGSAAQVFVNQKILRDDSGKMTGLAGLVHLSPEPSPDVKKKLW